MEALNDNPLGINMAEGDEITTFCKKNQGLFIWYFLVFYTNVGPHKYRFCYSYSSAWRRILTKGTDALNLAYKRPNDVVRLDYSLCHVI